MHMHHWIKGDWLLMFHYNLFVGVNRQGGPRGVTKFESTSWFMPVAYHKLGKGTLQLRGMFSAEPFTVSPGGSPLLFQTGETYKGQPLIDLQHQHDLFMELSAQYTLPLGERGTWLTYFGYPGEPALGPVTVLHRGHKAKDFEQLSQTRRAIPVLSIGGEKANGETLGWSPLILVQDECMRGGYTLQTGAGESIGWRKRAVLISSEAVQEVIKVDSLAPAHQCFGRRTVEAKVPNIRVIGDG